MKAVILESYVMEEGDLDWSGVKALVPDTVSYVRTAYEEIAPRIGDADIVLLNKCRMDEEILQQCPNLKWVGIIACIRRQAPRPFTSSTAAPCATTA